jgi:hypothetical protein
MESRSTFRFITTEPEVTDETVYYWNVIDTTKYSVKVQKCVDIMDLSNHFLSLERLLTMDADFNDYNTHAKTVYDVPLIMSVCDDWIATIKDGCASTRKVPAYAAELMNSVSLYMINQWLRHRPIEGTEHHYRVTPNGLFLAGAQRTRPFERTQRIIQRDYKNLIRLLLRLIQVNHNLDLTYPLYADGARVFFEFCKNFATWREIKNLCKNDPGCYDIAPCRLPEDDLKYMKQLWDDPNLMNKFTTNYNASSK